MDLSTFEVFQKQALDAGVVFYHTGEFTSPIIAAAAEALKHRMQESGASGPATRKLFSTFVEMAQNIHHYGAADAEVAETDTTNHAGAGTITIVKSESDFQVICVNRIETSQIPRLTQKLDAVRSMSLDEIKKAYKEQLKNTEHAQTDTLSKGAGLGWLTIARDSKQPLEYSFMSDPKDSSRFAYFLVKAVI